MRFADTHCHMDFEQLEGQRDSLLISCRKLSIDMLVVPATKRSSWDKILKTCMQCRQLYPALGLHPYFLSEHAESDLSDLDNYLSEYATSVVAVGEMGLDASIANMSCQKFFLESQLEIASRHKLPVILHSRKTHAQMLKSIKKYDFPGGVVHAFSGSLQELKQFTSLGLCIGVGGVITWPRSTKTQAAIQEAPLECLVLETDAPDMPVVGEAKGQATPLNTIKIFKALCQLRPESPEYLASILWENSLRLFGVNNCDILTDYANI